MFPEGLTAQELNAFSKDTMVEHIDIEFTEVGPDYIVAKMPVNNKTRQPMGLLHGGASVVLAETLGSVAASVVVAPLNKVAVGLEISANHLKGKRDGFVIGTANPLHIGRSTHLWEIKIRDEDDQLICVSKITMAILDKK
ncbi:MAG: hotdog fold thioesterase [Marinoscillum sp.]